jgi:hypothetical protein
MTRSRERWVLAGLLALLVAPLVVALVVLRRPQWFPVLDLAMTEYRVRDVFTAHTPLIGLPGRIGRTLAQQGSHPGPLSFYALAPTYRLLGKSAWAMQVGTVVIHAVAMAVSLVIARRRGGLRLAIAVAALLALLTRGFGLSALTEPWNPYLPLLWWVAFLLAVWSVVVGDVAMLPVAVLVASFCAQTHVPYLAITLGLGAVAAVAVVRHEDRARALRWSAAAVVLGLVLWAPPVIDQIVHRPGNFTLLYRHFTDPPEPPVGLGTGVRLALLHLDFSGLAAGRNGSTGSLVVATSEPTGSVVPGVVVLVVWLAAAVVAFRRRHRTLLGLHAVVAAGLVFGAISMGRIFGDLWYYLMLWAWAVGALLVLAVVLTVATFLGERERRIGTALLAAVTVVSAALFAVDARHAQPPAPRLSSTLGRVVGPTMAALDRRDRYVVTWSDALHIGSQAYGLVSELERHGYRVGMTEGLHVPLTDYRVVPPSEATAEIHFATGIYVDEWRAKPEAKELVYVEPRSPAEQQEFDRLRARVLDRLGVLGLDDVAAAIDANLFGASIDRRVPRDTRELIARMLDLGEPTAVFLAPAGTTP